MHIYLALAIDRFLASGWKQKSFSLEWKEFYLLWIHDQDAIELMPTTGYFNPYRPRPCCPVTGSLSAPQKPLSPREHLLLLALPVASQRQSVFRARALLTPTANQWDPHSYKAHSPPFAKTPCHPSALVPGSLCLMNDWPHQGGDEGESSQGAHALVQLHQHGLLRHPPPSPAHMPAEAAPISLVFWMGKSTVYSHRAQEGRQQTKSMNRCALSLDAKYSPWGWLPSLQLTRRAAAIWYGVGWDNVRPHMCAPAWLSGSWGSTISHKHMPAQPGLTASLLPRQHGTFALLLFVHAPPNTPRKQFPLPASCVLRKPAKPGCLGSDRIHCLGKSRLWSWLSCAAERQSAGQKNIFQGAGQGAADGSWLALPAS